MTLHWQKRLLVLQPAMQAVFKQIAFVAQSGRSSSYYR